MGELKLIIIPDADDPDAADIFVDGAIDGRPYRFLLDTGAARTSVLRDDYTAQFASAEQHHSSGVFAPSSEDVITVPRIEVGPIVKEDVAIVRRADGNPHVRSLIGMDLLKAVRCHFRFDEARVAVDEDAPPEGALAWRDLRLDAKFHPYVDVAFGVATGSAVWDTGAGLTIVDTAFIAAHPAFFEAAGTSTGTDATGAQMETPMYRMAETIIGGYTFASHTVAGVDLAPVNAGIEMPMDLILGYSTLIQAHWLFDFPRRRWAIAQRVTAH